MKQVKRIFGKSKVLLLALFLIGGSAGFLIASINSVQAAQEKKVTVTENKPAAILEEGDYLTSSTTSPDQRKFTIVDMTVPASKKSIPDYSPSEKDISREAAADKIAGKITSLAGDDLDGYTAAMMVYLLKERATWLGAFTSADQKTTYTSRVDAVTGEVWQVDRTTRQGNGGEELFNNSTAVFGYDLKSLNRILNN